MLTILLSLIPSVIIRWALIRRPLSNNPAVIISAIVWTAAFVGLIALGSSGQSAGFLSMAAGFGSFWILRSGAGKEAAPGLLATDDSLHQPVEAKAIYSTIAEEIESGHVDKALWTKAFADADANEEHARAIYTRLRAAGMLPNSQVRTDLNSGRWGALNVLIIVLAAVLIAVLGLIATALWSKTPTATVIDYGTYDAVILTSGKWELGMPVTIASVSGLKHQQTVTRIPTEDGRYWGFRARLTNPLKDRAVSCRYTIDHPEFTVPDGTKSSTESQEFEIPPGDSITQEFLWFFIAGCEHEFVPGSWTWKVFLDDRELVRRDFEVYSP